jgi:glycosyltransferase involved in cell wall biosynthesis
MLSREHEVRVVTSHLPENSKPFWVESVADDGHDYVVKRFDDRISTLNLRGHRLSRGLIPPMSFSAIAALRREVRSFRPALLLTFFGVPFGIPALAVRALEDVPVALVLCGTDIPSPRTAGKPLWTRWLRFVTARVDKAVYVSRFCFDALEVRPFRSSHDVVIGGGVDRRTLRAKRDATAIRAELGIAPDELMLFSLQRLGPEKRVDIVVKAFALARQSDDRLRLVIGGRSSEYEALADLIERLGLSRDVTLLGHLGDEKADYYAACDMFVFHSMFETFGQVLAEAMMFGKPVVSVTAGAIPDVVDDGETGVLVPPMDEVALADAIVRMAGDRAARERMGAAGREKAQRCYSWDRRILQWRELVQPTATEPVSSGAVAAADGRVVR